MNCTCGWESEKEGREAGRQAGRQAGRNGKERKRKEERKKEPQSKACFRMEEFWLTKLQTKSNCFIGRGVENVCMIDKWVIWSIHQVQHSLLYPTSFICMCFPFFPSSQRFEPRRIWHSVSKECSQAHTVWCRCTSSQGMNICNNLILIHLWLSHTYRSNMSQCLGYDYCSLKKWSGEPSWVIDVGGTYAQEWIYSVQYVISYHGEFYNEKRLYAALDEYTWH